MERSRGAYAHGYYNRDKHEVYLPMRWDQLSEKAMEFCIQCIYQKDY